MEDLITSICDGAITFDDTANGDNLQARINKAWAKAETMRTPWFIHEYIMDTCRDDIEDIARCTAQSALYTEENEHVISGIA